jgi:MFS family permease
MTGAYGAAEETASPTRVDAEAAYNAEVERNLTRNYLGHLAHGLLGQTGFRLLNAPTFLPAYVMFLSGGSNLAVGVILSLQAFGMVLTPLIGANLIEHRTRVLPVGFVTGWIMRAMVLLIALAGLVLEPEGALIAIGVFILAFGLFMGMQGVIFNFLMSKVIPVSRRGRLTGLRNFLAGITSAGVAWFSGEFLLGDTPTVEGYSYTFLMAFVLTSVGLATLLVVREPEPPTVRTRTPLGRRLRELPALLRADRAFTRYVLARALATMGRMAAPFYILFAGREIGLTGTTLGVLTVAFTLSGTFSNLFWGWLADRFGFRLAFLGSIGLWIASTLALMFSSGLWPTALVFIGIGAAFQGFQHASMNLTLEFGERDDLPMRIALANTASEIAGTVGPLLGGALATGFGYQWVFYASILFLTVGGALVARFVPEPRNSVLSVAETQARADEKP